MQPQPRRSLVYRFPSQTIRLRQIGFAPALVIMSDNENFDFLPLPSLAQIASATRCQRQRAITRILELEAIAFAESSLAEATSARPGNIRDFGEYEQALSAFMEAHPVSGDMPGSRRARNNTAAEPVTQEPKKPITTLIPMLSMTTYDEAEAEEAGEPERTLAYVKVQCQLLKWLGTNASETLTPLQARRWTQEISADKKTTAQDALRLCYYMRSQTFDTYADLKGGSVSLYVVNQGTEERGPKTDKLYWKQNTKTKEIEYTAPSSRHHGGGRRNAFVAPSATADIEGLLAQLSSGHPPPPPPGFPFGQAADWGAPDGSADGWDAPGSPANVWGAEGEGEDEDAADGDDGDDGDEQPTAAGASAALAQQPTRGALAVLLAGATADLDALLTSDHPDPT
jgi:hypothetical protein